MKKLLLTLLIAFSLTSTAHASLTDGLVAQFTFNGQYNTWTSTTTGISSSTVGGYTTTFTGMNQNTGLVAGRIGQALNLFNANDYTKSSTINHNIGTGDFTWVAWVYLNDYSAGAVTGPSIMTNGEFVPWFGVNANATGHNNALSIYWGGWNTFNTPVTLNKWHMAVLQRTSGVVSAYLDGVKEATTFNIATDMLNRYYYFGVSQSSLADKLHGKLDDIRIYNRSLSLSEIKELYTNNIRLIKSSTGKNYVSSQASISLAGPLNQGLIAWWPFDGQNMNWASTTAGLVQDISGINNQGTTTGLNANTATQAGAIGQGIAFNGSGIVTVIPKSNLRGMQYVSWAFWAKPDAIVDAGAFIGWWSSTIANAKYLIRMGSSGTLQAYVAPGGVQIGGSLGGNGVVEAGKWNHYVVTWDGTNLIGYKNGVALDPYYSGSGLISNSAGGLFNLGDDNTASGVPWKGMKDDVRIYNRTLTQQDALELYLQGKNIINKN